MMIEHEGVKFYCDKRLYRDMEIAVQDIVEADNDILVCCCGFEGSGKSVLSRQLAFIIAYILLKKYNIEQFPTINNIHFGLDSYIKSSLQGAKYQINILDESRSILNRKSSMSRDSKRFCNYVSECRKMNQVHILNLPSFHDLSSYIVYWRCKYILRVMTHLDPENEYKRVRGKYLNYPIDSRLRYHYKENKYTYPEFNPKQFGGFSGTFTGTETFKDYKKLVANQMNVMADKYLSEKVDPIRLLAFDLVARGRSVDDVADTLKKNRSTVYKWLKEKGEYDNRQKI